jgi:hypothetical protein
MIRMPTAIAALLALTACEGERAPTFTAVAITLPEDSGTFPDRSGVAAITANCTACHSPSMILNQPPLTRDQWRSSIAKMREVYRASIDPAAEAAILDYLEATSAAVQ